MGFWKRRSKRRSSPPWDVTEVQTEWIAQRIRNWVEDPAREPELDQRLREGQPIIVRRPEQWEIEQRQYYPLYLRAYALERTGNIDESLIIYRYILHNYTPIGTVYYERPAILLERRGEYQEALAICDMAIANLKQEKAREHFRRRKARLEKKMGNAKFK